MPAMNKWDPEGKLQLTSFQRICPSNYMLWEQSFQFEPKCKPRIEVSSGESQWIQPIQSIDGIQIPETNRITRISGLARGTANKNGKASVVVWFFANRLKPQAEFENAEWKQDRRMQLWEGRTGWGRKAEGRPASQLQTRTTYLTQESNRSIYGKGDEIRENESTGKERGEVKGWSWMWNWSNREEVQRNTTTLYYH